MPKKVALTKDITEAEFDNGNWYADEIKAFAKQLGIPYSSKLRKDELEKLIKQFIRKAEKYLRQVAGTLYKQEKKTTTRTNTFLDNKQLHKQ